MTLTLTVPTPATSTSTGLRLPTSFLLSLLAAVGCYSGVPSGPDAAGQGEQGLETGAADGTGGAAERGDEGAEGSASDGSEGGDGGVDATCDEGIKIGAGPLRRLTRREYNNTVADLIGDTSNAADLLPLDSTNGFDTNAEVMTSPALLIEGYENAADTIVENRVADPDALLACQPGAARDDCVKRFIADFGTRAYRRQLRPKESDELFGFYTAARGQFTEPTAVALLVKAVLMSPDFLYRLEFGTPDPNEPDVIQLNDWEVASRLSYLLWNTMPDDELFAAAEAGVLHTPKQIETQTRRMLESPRALDVLNDFHGQWLGYREIDSVAKEQSVYRDFTVEARALLREESETFIEREIWEGSGSYETLFNADHTYMNAELASFYKLPGGPAGAEFERVDMDPQRYAGLLTQAGVLATHSSPAATSPILRGEWVLTTLACTTPPPPPDDVGEPPEPSPDTTTRERFAEHTSKESCAACHKLLDPLGFAFEGFGADGRWRATENGFPVDTTGEVSGLGPDLNGPVSGANELADRVATSEKVRECVARQWFRYGHGRAESSDDQCSVDHMESALRRHGGSVKELLVELVKTDAFLYRRK